MPKQATEKLNRAITEAIKQPEVAARFKDMGLEHVSMSPEEFRLYLVQGNREADRDHSRGKDHGGL